MYKKSTCKIAILMKLQYELYFDEGLSSHFETLYCIYLYVTHEYSDILPGNFFEPTTSHRTQFFVQKFNFLIKDGRMQLPNIQANESVQCMSHRNCPCISNKICVIVTELQFVFDNTTVKEHLKKILKISSLV